MAERSTRTNEERQKMRNAFIYKDIPWYNSPGDITMLISWFGNTQGHTVVDHVQDSLLFKNISSSVVLRKRWDTLCEFMDILQIGENLIDEAILNINYGDLESCLDPSTSSTTTITAVKCWYDERFIDVPNLVSAVSHGKTKSVSFGLAHRR